MMSFTDSDGSERSRNKKNTSLMICKNKKRYWELMEDAFDRERSEYLSHEHKEEIQFTSHKSMDLLKSSVRNNSNNNNNNNNNKL